jgi:hypothetical protein
VIFYYYGFVVLSKVGSVIERLTSGHGWVEGMIGKVRLLLELFVMLMFKVVFVVLFVMFYELLLFIVCAGGDGAGIGGGGAGIGGDGAGGEGT